MTHDSKEQEELARDLALAFHGDEVEWRGFLPKAALILSNKSARFAAKAAPQPGMRAEGEAKQLAARLIGYVQARPEYSFDLLLMHVSEAISMFVRDLPAASPAEADYVPDDQVELGVGAYTKRRTAPPKSAPDAMRETDFRWLVEAPGTRYLAVQRLSMSDSFEWTNDHDKALAFRSGEQATALMMAVRQMDRMYAGGSLFAFEATLGNAKAVEHGWLSAPVPPPDGAAEASPYQEMADELERQLKAPPSDDVRSALADELHAFCASAPQNYPGHNIELFERAEAALRSAPVSAPGTLEQLARHFETRKYGADRYLFPDEIASEIRQFAPAPAVGVTREAIARTIAPESFAADYQHYYPDRSMLEQFEAFKKADAILALSPAPDATVSEPVVRDTNMFSRLSNEPPAVIPEGYSAPLDIRTAAEIQHDRLAAKSSPQHVGREAAVSGFDPASDPVSSAIMGAAKLHTHDHEQSLKITRTAMTTISAASVSARDAVIEELQRAQAWLDTIDGVSLPSLDVLIAWYAERPSLRSAIRSLTGAKPCSPSSQTGAK